MDCSAANPAPTCFATARPRRGEAGGAHGPVVTSAVGTTLSYGTLAIQGILMTACAPSQAGCRRSRRRVDFLRSTGDVRYYKSFGDGAVAMTRLQAGTIAPYGGQTLPLTAASSAARRWCAALRPTASARAISRPHDHGQHRGQATGRPRAADAPIPGFRRRSRSRARSSPMPQASGAIAARPRFPRCRNR